LTTNTLFQSFFLGGFECSTHRTHAGKRLDLLKSTNHDRHALADYRRLHQHGIHAVRDGIRWHLIESSPGHYDFSSVLPMIHAARHANTQVIWDLCHYGWPDDIDIFSTAFVRRFRRFVAAFMRVLQSETDAVPFVCPVNEISFFAWGGGDVGYLNPFAVDRGQKLKAQLVRASIEAIEAVWHVAPQARIIHCDPVINVIPDPYDKSTHAQALTHHESQFTAWDMLAGRKTPELGGAAEYLDVIGVNYYPHNQWIRLNEPLERDHALYKPFREILHDVYQRYRRPLFVAETGTEGEAREDWLRYMCDEVRGAISMGVPIHGVCLYPILDYPGWDDDRMCATGLWGYADDRGERVLCEPLAHELHHQQSLMEAVEVT
jgi:beta-glucosidase/6-phospho-beta-glucosidase/beta-galactosidase